MKKFLIGLAVVAGVLVGIPGMIGMWAVGKNNAFVTMDEGVQQTYAQVQNVMQRQAELLPNLVEVVKAEAKFEQGTLTQVTEARARLTAVAKMDPAKLANDPKLQEELIKAQQVTQQALLNINAVREAYPALQSNQSFRALMTEISGSQNRITVERRRNQLAVQDFNSAVRKFPGSLVAGFGGFQAKPYFQAEETAQRTPQVKF